MKNTCLPKFSFTSFFRKQKLEEASEKKPQQGIWFVISASYYKDLLAGSLDKRYKLSEEAVAEKKHENFLQFLNDCNYTKYPNLTKIVGLFLNLKFGSNKRDSYVIIYSPYTEEEFKNMLFNGNLSKTLQYSRSAEDFINKIHAIFNSTMSESLSKELEQLAKPGITDEEIYQKFFFEEAGLIKHDNKPEEITQPTLSA